LRGQRVGEKLLNLAKEEVASRGGKNIYLVAKAPGFFKTQGFKIVKQEEAPLFYECAHCPQFNVDCFPEIMKLEV
jgi:N-acetylglutamate synthase-like GNAT family acetyltransferase